MSRVTQALRRSGWPSADSPRMRPREGEQAAWTSVTPPWDLDALGSTPGPAAPTSGETQQNRTRRQGVVPPEDLSVLVQRIIQRRPNEAPIRSALFTGVDADMGSEAVCVGTAVELSMQTSGTLCVIDCNRRSSTLTEALDLPGTPGLSDVLLGRDAVNDCLVRIAPNVWFLPPGTVGGEVETRITAEQMRAHLRDCLTTFDYVLLDSGPLTAQNDGALLGTLVDAVVLVVDARSTRREAARRAARQLRSAQVNVIGAVLTNRTFPIPDAIYRTL